MESCRTDGFSIGSIVRSTGYRVLHRPVEPAPVFGIWLYGLNQDLANFGESRFSGGIKRLGPRLWFP
jgi:hypothetical protein